jgi:hypothetical protein
MNKPESSSTMLTKHDRELAIQLFKSCIKHKESQKIMKLVHISCVGHLGYKFHEFLTLFVFYTT